MEVSPNIFHIFRKFGQISKKIANSLKSSKIGITPVKTTEILRNSEKNRRKFDENLQNLPSLSKINKNCAEFCKNGAKVLKNHRNLEWCKGKKFRSRQELSNECSLAKAASIQLRTSLSKLESAPGQNTDLVVNRLLKDDLAVY